MRKIALLALIPLVFLAACGGGGGGSGSLGGGSGSGGSGGSGGGSGIPTSGANVATLTVDPGPPGVGAFNTPYITVTICAPGSTTNCQTIDHVEVDTGSYGLRIISTVINSTLMAALPKELTPGFSVPIAECTVFGDGYAWGSMRTADLTISSEKAAGIPMQVIGDLGIAPTDCQNAGLQTAENTVTAFGANGILGVGPFLQDCGDACANGTPTAWYYSCPNTTGSSCSPTQIPLNMQASNPVASFATDNNGVIVEMPSIADAGVLKSTGALVFGIDTQSNNMLGSAKVLTTDLSAYITINYKNVAYAHGFLDSGSNLYFLNDSSITTCQIGGTSANNTFFCPSSEQTLSATNIGVNNTQSTVSFLVANAKTVLSANSSFTAFDNVAAPNSDPKGFDFGMPFFYGRSVFTAIEGRNTSGGMGPYFAY